MVSFGFRVAVECRCDLKDLKGIGDGELSSSWMISKGRAAENATVETRSWLAQAWRLLWEGGWCWRKRSGLQRWVDKSVNNLDYDPQVTGWRLDQGTRSWENPREKMLAKRVRGWDGLAGKGEMQVGGTLWGRRLLLKQDGWRGAQIRRGGELQLGSTVRMR